MKFNRFKTINALLLTCATCLYGSSSCESNTQHVHVWIVESDTATCEKSGIKTYKCKCGETKTKNSPQKDHEWNSADNCELCWKYKYDITATNSIPCTVGYKLVTGGGYYSKTNITYLSFYTYQNKIRYFGYGKKTFDYKGEETGDTAVCFKIKLLCSTDNEVLGITEIYKSNIAVGQKFTFDVLSNVSSADLSQTKKYTATIFDGD